jgi:adenylate kinase
LAVAREEVVKRLSGRRTCRGCGASYHIIFAPPRNPGICNQCNGELFQRDDDQQDTVIARLEVYERSSAPLVAAYRQSGLLCEVDGVGGQEQVLERILARVQASE